MLEGLVKAALVAQSAGKLVKHSEVYGFDFQLQTSLRELVSYKRQ